MKKKRGLRILSALCILLCLCVSVSAAPRFEPETEEGVLPQPEATPAVTPEPELEMGGFRTEDDTYVNPYEETEIAPPTVTEEPETEEQPQVYEPVNLDNFTGQVVNSSSSSLVALNSTCTYDRELDAFIYQVNNTAGSTFVSTVPNGAVVQMSVALQIPDTLIPVLYRDGAVVANPDYSNIVEKGSYSLSINQDGEVTPGVFSFTIIGNVLGQAYRFYAPSLFPILYAEGPSGSIRFSDFEAPLDEEGEYSVIYGNAVIDRYFSVTFTVDNSAPELIIEGPDENGVARCPVLLYNYNNEDTLAIYKDNAMIDNALKLTETGSYLVMVTDAAGNFSTYSFTIRTYLDTLSWIFMGVVTLLAAAAVFFIVFERKKFRRS